MKVLVVHTFAQYPMGNDDVVRNEVKLLKSYGLEVELLCLSVATSNFSAMLKVGFDYSVYRQIKSRALLFKPDVLQLHHLHLGALAAAARAAIKFRLPLVYTPHNFILLCPSETLFYKDRPYTESLRQSFPYRSIKKAFYLRSKVLTFALSVSMFIHHRLGTWNRIDKIIVSGETVRELFAQPVLAALLNRIVFNPTFCYPPEDEKKEPGIGSYYLYAGSFTDEEGLPVLLEAFADSGLPVKVAGHGLLKKLVFGYAEFYPNITLVSTEDENEIRELLENAAALVFPSVWYEPFGTMIVKAFSMGIPVIASDLGILSEMVTHGYNGLLFEAGNDKDLRQKVDYFQALNYNESQQYRANARHSYEDRYTPHRFAPELVGIYESLCQAAEPVHILKAQ